MYVWSTITTHAHNKPSLWSRAQKVIRHRDIHLYAQYLVNHTVNSVLTINSLGFSTWFENPPLLHLGNGFLRLSTSGAGIAI
jgi:hypothetical protein